MIGRDWTHPGVAKLFTDITNNGYHLLYLTSRSVGQADTTRGYLKSIIQGIYTIPEGPVIMSPDRTFTALRRSNPPTRQKLMVGKSFYENPKSSKWLVYEIYNTYSIRNHRKGQIHSMLASVIASRMHCRIVPLESHLRAYSL